MKINNLYSVLFEDTQRTFNINMHLVECFAKTKKGAIKRAIELRPAMKGREVLNVKVIA